MSKYVPDILSRRWVLISPARTDRPDDANRKDSSQLRSNHNDCVFCPGNEHMTSSEVFRLGGGEKDKPGWKVRVIPNKYPITDFHEVIIHNPSDDKDIENLPLDDVAAIINVYRSRYNYYKDKGEVLIFCNHGEHAGASIKHPHSQLVVIPFQINIDAVSREPLNNIVTENDFFNVYCPDFSQWPYEVWIAPKKEGTVFGDITDEELTDLSEIMQRTIKRIEEIYEKERPRWINMGFGYNYYIYPKENWYLRIIPRFIHRAGFELGTGLSVNIIDPIEAASFLRGEEKRMGEVLSRLKGY